MLLLVVLSVLVLFMLIGTAFMVSSSQYRTAATEAAKAGRVRTPPDDLLNRALMQVLRDTNNPESVVRYHSLLRDLYGSEGFEAEVYRPVNAQASAHYLTRYADDASLPVPSSTAPLGPTHGQFIDIYVKQLRALADDPETPSNAQVHRENTLTLPDERHVLTLERDAQGQRQTHILPLTKGYYNGCLLTITSGPARGQSTRILDYQYVRDLTSDNNGWVTRLFRFRVMGFSRADGGPVEVRDSASSQVIGHPTNPNEREQQRYPEIRDLVSDQPDSIGTSCGVTFIVNGRPYNGTGVGYNPLAAVGMPRLSAVETVAVDPAHPIYPEIALTPNSVYFFPYDFRSPLFDTNPNNDILGARYPVLDPTTGLILRYDPLNPKRIALADRALQWKYQSFIGPGDADESYDAADFQNMFLALQTVTPRARGRVVLPDDGNRTDPDSLPDSCEVDDPRVMSKGQFVGARAFLRLDLEDLPLPSFHRPALVNYWYHQLLAAMGGNNPTDDQVRAILTPYGADNIRDNASVDPTEPTGVPLATRDQIVALKRKIMLRPLREDNPDFDGGNPQSRPPDLTRTDGLVRNGNIAIPYWEVVGPWDVDNDNDGVPDSVWVDLGDPVQAAEDGTLYKPLYAFLIVDLDSRLNVNAHGLVDDIMPTNLAIGVDPNTGQLVSEPNLAGVIKSDVLPQGLGYGPADISLRPLFPAPIDLSGNPWNVGNRLEDYNGDGKFDATVDGPVDDYAALLYGRVLPGNTGVVGRYGFMVNQYTFDRASAGINYRYTPDNPLRPTMDLAAPDVLAQFKFFDYPLWLTQQSAFGSPPDLLGRYALGLDYAGQPVVEAAYDVNPDSPATSPLPYNLLADSPYELDLSAARRCDVRADGLYLSGNFNFGAGVPQTDYRDAAGTLQRSVPGVASDTDDAPFATADLERILRAHDADAGMLASRLWDVVAAFDPVKLFNPETLESSDPYRVLSAANGLFDPLNQRVSLNDTSQMFAAAQQIAGINRRLVTTDSYDLPVPGGTLPDQAELALGADGQPGRAGVDDDGNGVIDYTATAAGVKVPDVGEIGWPGSDDFASLFGKSPAQGTIVDLLKYRVWKEMRKDVMRREGWDENAVATLSTANYQKFMAVVTARANAIVDGEPFTDTNGNGQADPGEYIDVPLKVSSTAGNGVYDAPQLPQLLAPEVIAGQRMDLNRPFGDGRDDGDGMDNDSLNGADDPGEMNYPVGDSRRDPFLNGIVDEPAEAGDPFLDVNGNGKRDDGTNGTPVEPFINEDGSTDASGVPTYTPPRDHLWQGLATGEPIGFDYTNGHGEPIHPAVQTALGTPALGGVRNLSSEARQLYARQLYCLMMLLVDDGYLETPEIPTLEGTNVNLEFLIRDIASRRHPTNPTPDQDDLTLALHKLTCRRIAQWAINCVDFRDADDIMTPFEYDENPWDGWGTRDRDGRLIPLDGDPATDENGSETMAEGDLPTKNVAQVINWSAVPNGPDGQPKTADDNTKMISTAVTGPTSVADQTRGLVWGTERPELLITETLALHDRRSTDEDIPDAQSPKISFAGSDQEPPDYDLDQRLKPRGSLFVELYNPWSPDGEKPAEVYGQVDVDPDPNKVQLSAPGVMLDKLSNAGVSRVNPVTHNPETRYSPVWRMAVVREPFSGFLTNQIFDVTLPASPTQQQLDAANAAAYKALNSQKWVLDPDGFGFNSDLDAERLVYFTTGDNYATEKQAAGDSQDESDLNRSDDDNLESTTSQLGEYTFTPGPAGSAIPVMNNLKVWVPPLPWRVDNVTGLGNIKTPTAKRYFIARTERQKPTLITNKNDSDVEIAPILPGRYAVVGTSGLQLKGVLPQQLTGQPGFEPYSTPDGQVTDRFVTPVSRLSVTAGGESDAQLRKQLYETRRIELWPRLNPNVNQLLVADNGGPEFVRMGGGTPTNVTDPELDNDPTDTPRAGMLIDPCVAIPVEDLNISEPVEGYPSHEYQDLYKNLDDKPVEGKVIARDALPKGEVVLNTDGQLEFKHWYDHPLDLDIELVRNGTTQNYRTLHLQRLANPTLPWNPPPLNRDGTPNPLHQRNLPVNPYLTVDSQSVDLTAYNGASSQEETSLPTPSSSHDSKISGDLSGDPTQLEVFAPITAEQYKYAPDHVLWGIIYIRSTELHKPWITPKQFRDLLATPNGKKEIENDFVRLMQLPNRSGSQQDQKDWLNLQKDPRNDQYGRDWSGQWGWSLFRRVLPDDITKNSPEPAGIFRQHLSLKSLERGAHDYVPEFKGWWYDQAWVPRLLWKQEPPNINLWLRNTVTSGLAQFSDLVNVPSKRQFMGQFAATETGPPQKPPQDVQDRDQLIRTNPKFHLQDHTLNYVLEQTLGFANESYAPELDRPGNVDAVAMMAAGSPRPGAPEVAVTTPQVPADPGDPDEVTASPRAPSDQSKPAAQKQAAIGDHRRRLMQSTYSWLAWNNRPFVSAEEIMQVPASSSSLMLRDYSTINDLTPNPYDGNGVADPIPTLPTQPPDPETATDRIARQRGAFGHLLNFFLTADKPAGTYTTSGASPEPLSGAPNFYRILDYVQVPSRYVGTDTMLDPAVFNDNPLVNNAMIPGEDILSPDDPRYAFQPPFNEVSRERDPGRVNLNTVLGERTVDSSGIPRLWSEVYDGIMHRYPLRDATGRMFAGDGNWMDWDAVNGVPVLGELGQPGPAWRDVALSRRGYAQVNADGGPGSTTTPTSADKPWQYPDTFTFGLNRNFPTFFANPFRSPDAGDLVPLESMMQYGVDASWLRVHPYGRGEDSQWGSPSAPALQPFGDARDAGFGDDLLSCRSISTTSSGYPVYDGAIPGVDFGADLPGPVPGPPPTVWPGRDMIPLFSEMRSSASLDSTRNSGMMYQPMTRLGNLVTTRSGVFAVWITVGYFEVEPAPDWGTNENNVQEKFGGDGTATAANPTNNAVNTAARALYDRVYPEGYMLGREMGSDTGNTKRERAFFIVDRTQPVGFKPGEDLNVEDMIRVRRRIE